MFEGVRSVPLYASSNWEQHLGQSIEEWPK